MQPPQAHPANAKTARRYTRASGFTSLKGDSYDTASPGSPRPQSPACNPKAPPSGAIQEQISHSDTIQK
jgi:hypothetical protein